MMVPGIVYIIINNYIPMTGIVVAFKQYNTRLGLYNSPNIGLKNFEFLFRTKDALLITRNTLLYNLAFIVLGTVVSIAVAVLLNEIKLKKAQQVYQTVILVPFLISIVIVSYLVNAFLPRIRDSSTIPFYALWGRSRFPGIPLRNTGLLS